MSFFRSARACSIIKCYKVIYGQSLKSNFKDISNFLRLRIMHAKKELKFNFPKIIEKNVNELISSQFLQLSNWSFSAMFCKRKKKHRKRENWITDHQPKHLTYEHWASSPAQNRKICSRRNIFLNSQKILKSILPVIRKKQTLVTWAILSFTEKAFDKFVGERFFRVYCLLMSVLRTQ